MSNRKQDESDISVLLTAVRTSRSPMGKTEVRVALAHLKPKEVARVVQQLAEAMNQLGIEA